MATKTTRPEGAGEAAVQPEQPLLAVEALRDKHKTARPLFAGVCAANGWKPGRAMTEDAFLQAVAAFTGAPIGRALGKEGGHA